MKQIRWVGVAAVLVALAALAVLWALRARYPVRLTTGYQAVLLSYGSVYYGKLEGLGAAYPVLRDVFYVQVGVGRTPNKPPASLSAAARSGTARTTWS
jgi:hypothetical protein